MDVKKLKAFNQIAVRHLEQFGTRDDFKIILEIATHQDEGECLTLKRLLLSATVPESTLKRRLDRLVKLRFVLKKTTSTDRRLHCYTLAEKSRKILNDLFCEVRVFRWD